MTELDPLGRAIRARVRGDESVMESLGTVPPVIVAVSGGPDSTCLLHAVVHAARPAGVEVLAAHVAYGLRDTESADELAFVREICTAWRVPLAELHVGEASRRALRAGNLQARARDIRLRFFRRLGERGAVVALAHTRDDQVETFVLHALRGTGLSGLRGMAEERSGLFRPLLDVGRDDVVAYLERHGVNARTDSSNQGGVYLRNRVRHRVIPVLRELQPRADEVIARFMRILARDDDCLRGLAAELSAVAVRPEPGGGWSCHGEGLRDADPALAYRVLCDVAREAVGTEGFVGSRTVDELYGLVVEGREGAATTLGRTVRVVYAAERLYLVPEGGAGSYRVVVPHGVAEFDAVGVTVRGAVPDDLVTGQLVLRPAEVGERFEPCGFGGTKRVVRVLAEAGVPAVLRPRWPVLADDAGILWIVGVRWSRRGEIMSSVCHCASRRFQQGEPKC